MSKLWYRTRDEQTDKSELHEVDFNNFQLTGPTVIYLSGFLTTNNQPGFIAGALKRMEEMLDQRAEEDRKPVNLYAWSHSSLANVFNIASYNAFSETRYSNAGYVFARNVLLPLVATNIVNLKKKGCISADPLPVEQARANLRNLTMLTYSAGTITVQESYNAARKLFRQAGIPNDVAKDLLSEIVVLSTGTVSRATKERGRYTTVYLMASNDVIIQTKNALWSPLRTVASKVLSEHPPELRAERLSETSVMVTGRIDSQDWEWRVDKTGATKLARIRALVPSWTFINSNHELPYYITHDDKLSPFANIALYSLTNAIGRTEKLDVEKLIAPPASRPEGEAATYCAKMKAAAARAPKV